MDKFGIFNLLSSLLNFSKPKDLGDKPYESNNQEKLANNSNQTNVNNFIKNIVGNLSGTNESSSQGKDGNSSNSSGFNLNNLSTISSLLKNFTTPKNSQSALNKSGTLPPSTPKNNSVNTKRAPLQSSMLNVLNNHDNFVKRVREKNINK
jgi:hypothetical protein